MTTAVEIVEVVDVGMMVLTVAEVRNLAQDAARVRCEFGSPRTEGEAGRAHIMCMDSSPCTLHAARESNTARGQRSKQQSREISRARRGRAWTLELRACPLTARGWPTLSAIGRALSLLPTIRQYKNQHMSKSTQLSTQVSIQGTLSLLLSLIWVY